MYTEVKAEVKAVELTDGKIVNLNRILRFTGIVLDKTKDYYPNLKFTIISEIFSGIDEISVTGRLELKTAYFKKEEGLANNRTTAKVTKDDLFPVMEYYDPENFIFEERKERVRSRVVLTEEGNYIAALTRNMKKFKGYAEFKNEYDSLVRLWNNGKAVEKIV